MFVVVGTAFAALPFMDISLEKEGNNYSLSLSDLDAKIDLGSPTRTMPFGRMSPNDGVYFDVTSYKIPVEVKVVTSEGAILYQETRNGSLGTRLYPSRTSELILVVSDLCQDCEHDSWDHVYYVRYSRSPYYELLIITISLPVAACLMLTAYHFQDRVSRKGWHLLTILVPTYLWFTVWYLYAFDIGGLGAAVGAAIASVTATLTVLIFLFGGATAPQIHIENLIVLHDVKITKDVPVKSSGILAVSNLTADPETRDGSLTLTGQVTGRSGSPAPEAPVQIYLFENESQQWFPDKTYQTGSDGAFTVKMMPGPTISGVKPVVLDYADVRWVGKDLEIGRASLSGTKHNSTRTTFLFQNSGTLPTTLLSIESRPENVPDLRMRLGLLSSIPVNIYPNQAIEIVVTLDMDSEKGIVNTLEARGGAGQVDIAYTFTAPGGEQITKHAVLMVKLVG